MQKKQLNSSEPAPKKICFNQAKFFAYSMFLNNVPVKERQDLYDFAFSKNYWLENSK
jgi:hypothetical protein